MWQVTKLFLLFGVFLSTLFHSATDQHMDPGSTRFLVWAGTTLIATWFIGAHMKAELWPRIPRWLQKPMTVVSTILLTSIFVVSVTASAAVANAPTTPEGPPCSAVYSPYAPLCSFSSEA